MADSVKHRRPGNSASRSADRSANARRIETTAAAPRPPKTRSPPRYPHVEITALIEPALATLVRQPPDGDEWFHEVKFDGYRVISHIDTQQIRLQTRNKLDWTDKLGELATAIRRLKLRQAIFDGEIATFDEQGVSRLELLQAALHREPDTIVYVVFDLLFLKGEDLRGLPLQQRREVLASLKLPADRGSIRAAEHIVGAGGEFFEVSRRHGLDGIVSKRRDQPYRSGRTLDWLKCTHRRHGDFVIGGFTDPGFEREDVGALLVGYFDDQTELRCAGRVGAGLTAETIGEVLSRLKLLKTKESPFIDFPELGKHVRGAHWVRPELVAQVEFANWSKDGRLRQPRFQGLRDDKSPHEAVRENATTITSLPIHDVKRKRTPRPLTPGA
jgi:bifunctional non-homologous end joining protein LigD